jgi:DNA polymerase I-like protein with 3'-5' exonuclease and polymerase domains
VTDFLPWNHKNRRLLDDGTSVRTVTIDVDKKETHRTLTYELYYVQTDAGMQRVVDWALLQKALGVDIETSSVKPKEGKIATLQVGNPTGENPCAFVIDVRCVSREALQPLFDILQNRTQVKLGQNIGFECKWLQYHFNVRLRNVADTQVSELLVRCGLFAAKAARDAETNAAIGGGGERAGYKYSAMGRLAKHYLGLDLDKDHDLRTSFYDTAPGLHTERQLAYAAGDVIYIFYIAKKQKELLLQRSLVGVAKVEFENIPILSNAELVGIGLNVEAWRVLWQEALEKRTIAEATIDGLIRGRTLQQDLFDTVSIDKRRPIYPHSKKQEPMNYDATGQVSWTIVEYCKSIGWSREIVHTMSRLRELKKEYGQDWLIRRMDQNAKAIARGEPEKVRPATINDVPDYLIPTDKYCVLINTDKDTLKLRMVRGQLPQAIVRPLLDYGKASHAADSFGNAFLIKNVDPFTNRLHTEFHQLLTTTGRVSTSPNTQNIPNDPRYRRCFIPAKGKKFIIADYSQIEPRLSANESLDAVYTAAFLAGKDLYLQVAEAMFKRPVDKKTPEGKLLRQIAKVIVLGLAYRMGPWLLMDTLTLALADDILSGKVPLPDYEYTKKLYDSFFEECSGIREFQDLCSTLANHDDTTRAKLWDDFLGDVITWIEAPCGRKRFFAPEAKGVFTEAPNAPIQGGSATITKAAAALFQREIDARGYAERCNIVNLIHDEILGEVDEEIAQECAYLLKECMEKAAEFYIKAVPAPAEFPENSTGVVDYWTKAVEKEAA